MGDSHVEYSVVIPVFNSAAVVGETVRRTCAFFDGLKLRYEVVLVNDGSRDASWKVISTLAQENPRVIAIDLLRNSGQHNANLCGFRHTRGRWVITIDDDLQNPPEEIAKLIEKACDGHDLVIGRFREKQHAGYRRLGTRVVGAINRRIFRSPPGLVLSNFRLIRRDVVDRICNYNGPHPYIPGLCLLYSGNPTNVLVEHQAREVGESNYNLGRIASLISTILFNYSSFPLRLVAGLGLGVSLVSLILGVYYFLDGLMNRSSVPGWTTIVVMLAFFNGIVMLMLGMLGEYVVRVISQISMADPYFIREVRRSDD